LLGQGPKADTNGLDELAIRLRVQAAIAAKGGPIEGRNPQEILAALSHRRGPERLIDLALRTGPYGDGFGAREGISLAALEAAPHGIDLGPLTPRLPDVLRTPSGKIELAPTMILEDLPRLEAAIDAPRPASVLVGRRHLRSNNSWMHNLPTLAKGPFRCTLQVQDRKSVV